MPVDTTAGNTTKGNTEPDSDGTFSQTESTSDDYVEDLIEGKVNDSDVEDDNTSNDGDNGDSNVEVIYDRKAANATGVSNNACNRPATAIKQEFVHFHPVGVLSKQQVSNK